MPKPRRLATLILVGLVGNGPLTNSLFAGHGHCRQARVAICRPAVACQVPPSSFATAPAPTWLDADPADAASFAAWLNGLRSARRLAPCAVSPELCADAAENSRRGFGHAYMGRARRQNVAWGSLATACAGWLDSPAHAAALFDPTITRIGLAQVGAVITFAAD